MMLHAPALLDEDGVYYPTEDGEPLGETDFHVRLCAQTLHTLDRWTEHMPRVYVASNNLLYYERGDPRKYLCPDVYVVFGISKEPRDLYKLWVERKGPAVVIELTSKSTSRRDQVEKLRIYRDILKVREYFLFDPRQEYLKPAEKGYRLVRGVYVPIKPIAGRLPSKRLKLHLERDGWELRFYDPATEQRLPTTRELDERSKQAEAATAREAAAREQAEAAAAREAAARVLAEAETARLRRELEILKRRASNGV